MRYVCLISCSTSLGYWIGAGYVSYQCQVYPIIRSRDGNQPASFQYMAYIILPYLRILCISMGLRNLRACLQRRDFIRAMNRLRIASTRRTSIFSRMFKILTISNILHVRRKLYIQDTFSIPTIRALFRVIRLHPVVIIPHAVSLITTLSRRFRTRFPILMQRSRTSTVNCIQDQVASFYAIIQYSFSISICVNGLRIAQDSNYRYIRQEDVSFDLILMGANCFVTMRVASQMTYRYVTLTLVTYSSKMPVLCRAFRFITSNDRIYASEMSPIASLVSPKDRRFSAFILGLSGVTSTQCNSQRAQCNNRRILNVLLVMCSFRVRAIARRVNFGANFPYFCFLPARA